MYTALLSLIIFLPERVIRHNDWNTFVSSSGGKLFSILHISRKKTRILGRSLPCIILTEYLLRRLYVGSVGLLFVCLAGGNKCSLFLPKELPHIT